MKLDIAVQLRDGRWRKPLSPYARTVRQACGAALSATPLAQAECRFELCVVLADDALVRQLNHDYRGIDKPTNVLSFAGEEGMQGRLEELPAKGSWPLGDIVLAYDTLEREAEEQGKALREHALHLLAHGALHLAGYDHEEESQAEAMETLEIEILSKLGAPNPYLSRK